MPLFKLWAVQLLSDTREIEADNIDEAREKAATMYEKTGELDPDEVIEGGYGVVDDSEYVFEQRACSDSGAPQDQAVNERKGLQVAIEAGIEAAQQVTNRWESGDLAGAVNQLEDWATKAADYLDDEEYVDDWHCKNCGAGPFGEDDNYCAKCGTGCGEAYKGADTSEEYYACPDCGCTEIECTAWVNVNGDGVSDSEPPNDTAWCPQCSYNGQEGTMKFRHLVMVDEPQPVVYEDDEQRSTGT